MAIAAVALVAAAAPSGAAAAGELDSSFGSGRRRAASRRAPSSTGIAAPLRRERDCRRRRRWDPDRRQAHLRRPARRRLRLRRHRHRRRRRRRARGRDPARRQDRPRRRQLLGVRVGLLERRPPRGPPQRRRQPRHELWVGRRREHHRPSGRVRDARPQRRHRAGRADRHRRRPAVGRLPAHGRGPAQLKRQPRLGLRLRRNRPRRPRRGFHGEGHRGTAQRQDLDRGLVGPRAHQVVNGFVARLNSDGTFDSTFGGTSTPPGANTPGVYWYFHPVSGANST